MSSTEEEIIEERVYTVSFSKPIYGNSYTRRKRTPRAVRYLRNFVKKHFKLDDEGTVIIDPAVNHEMWKRGIERPPRRIKVRCVKSEEDVVEVFLV